MALDPNNGIVLQGAGSYCEILVKNGSVVMRIGREETGEWWAFSCGPTTARDIASDLIAKADEAEKNIE